MKDIIQVINHDEVPKTWLDYYEQALKTMPEGKIYYLTEEFLQDITTHIHLSLSHQTLIKETMQLIQSEASLRKLFWLCHTILFVEKKDCEGEVRTWPTLRHTQMIPKRLTYMFSVIVLLSGYPSVLAYYEQLGPIPRSIISDTLSTLDEYMHLWQEETGFSGLSPYHYERLLQHFRGELFRIGRFEYHRIIFTHPVRAYHHLESGKVKIVSEDGVSYRSDGHVDGTNHFYAPAEERWVVQLVETTDGVYGYPMNELGYCMQSKVFLRKNEWTLVLKQGDPVLGIHIPRKEKLSLAISQSSLKQARHFFRTFMPDESFKAFVCVSWMLDPELQNLLDDTSTIITFQKMFHLFPIQSIDATIYKFVFQCEPCPPEQLPEATTLQRNIKTYLLEGGHMHTGGGYLPF